MPLALGPDISESSLSVPLISTVPFRIDPFPKSKVQFLHTPHPSNQLIRIGIQIHLPGDVHNAAISVADPYPLVRDTDPDPSIIKQK